ncbi:uncharacterized protein [Onthophagus taurus]|uniref:uncharacterized protein n=1 Tax=Onthophagus taurus TaxID=166361 RepID=UPI000C20A7C1|nr:uncharacterized protein LOC111414041 [Onthophagus taurus]XP_022912429.1 uncharacterized protein LOC111423433 [Onthophagus taurus]
MWKIQVIMIWLSFRCIFAMDHYELVEKVMKGCLDGNNSLVTCLANKTEKLVDRLVDKDVPLFEGMVFKRNKEIVERRSLGLQDTLSRFLDSHTLTLDLTEPRGLREGDKGSGGFSDGFGKVDKKDKKYLYYALTAIAGIFGLSVPLVLKGLAILAGKALLASKAALIIIGSVALKKIFQTEKEPVNVHTHTVSVDDHDRISAINNGGYPYQHYQPYHSYAQY